MRNSIFFRELMGFAALAVLVVATFSFGQVGAAGTQGALEVSTSAASGILGSVVQITVSDADLSQGNADMPSVTAVRAGGGYIAQVPMYQTTSGQWVGYFRISELTFYDVNGNGELDEVNPTIVEDKDADRIISTGDRIVDGPNLGIGTPLTVLPTPPQASGPQALAGKFDDADGNGRFNGGEKIYWDADGSNTVSNGDKRLNAVVGYLAGSTVRTGDPDMGTALTRFNLESTPGNPPEQDPTPPASGFDSTPPYANEPNVTLVGLGTLVVDVPNIGLGDSITVTYADASPDAKVTATVTRTLSVGSVSLDSSTYSMFGSGYVTVNDPDLNLDPTVAEALTWGGVNLLTLKTSSNPTGVTLELVETGPNTSTFTARFQLGPVGTSAASQGFTVTAGDTVTAVYEDVDVAYGVQNATRTTQATVITTMGAVTFDKAQYDIGDTVRVQVSDPDLNQNSTVVEEWSATEWTSPTSPGGGVRVFSTSDARGIVLTMKETGPDTGVFTASFTLTPATSGEGRLNVDQGGDITAVYRDWTPLGIGGELGARAVDLTATASVAQPTSPAAITSVLTLDALGAEKTSFTPGETMLISASVKSTATTSQDILVAVQVFDPSDVVLPPSFIQTTLDAGKEFTFMPGVLLPSDAAEGEWTAEVSIFTGFPAQGGTPVAGPDTVRFSVT